MKKILTLAVLCTALTAYGQEVSRSTYSSAGGCTKDSNQKYTIDWTLGIQFSQIVKDTNHLTEGFQQGDYQPAKKKIEEAQERLQHEETLLKKKDHSIYTLYPNPATDRLFLKTDKGSFKEGKVVVLDRIGRTVLQQNIQSENKNEIFLEDISALSKGLYYVQITPVNDFPVVLNFIKN